MDIIKADGTKELFEQNKLRNSLKRAGAKEETIDYIVEHIQHELKAGDHTDDIYKHAFEILKRQRDRTAAALYSLRQAVSELGPSGYPFEVFVGEIYKAMGYKVKTSQVLQGECVSHEVDVVGDDGKEFMVAEAKFRNKKGYKTNVKVPLYVRSRFTDLEKTLYDGRWDGKMPKKDMIITNTKFTRNAIAYAACAGITLISWGYPSHGNLQDMINETGIHPITSLTTLTEAQKRLLLDKKKVLCRDIMKTPEILQTVGITQEKSLEIIEEIKRLCASKK